jgi:hypothetical protein
MPANAQQTENVYSVVKQIQSFDWYRTQAKLWKQELAKNNKNPDAWVNFYTANRMARITDAEIWNKEKGAYFQDLTEIVDNAEKAIPNTFEYYHLRVWDKGVFDKIQTEYLFKAQQLDPDRTEMMSNFVSYYEINRDRENMKKYCSKWFNSNDISSGILAYNYNVLNTLEDNAIIFTNGDNDTYPLWMLQYALGFKKEVFVININLIRIEAYRTKLFAENKIPAFDEENFKKDNKTVADYPQAFIKHIINNTKRPVYMASTLAPEYYSEYEKNLYLTGLALRYNDKDMDNMALIRKNYEKNLLLDYLKINFTNDLSETVVAQMNMGYLPAMFKLYEHYGLSGENEKKDEVKKLALKIAYAAGKEKEVAPWFEK